MKFDLSHYAILTASVLGLIGPDVLAHLTASQVGAAGQIARAVVVLASAVAGLFTASPSTAAKDGGK